MRRWRRDKPESMWERMDSAERWAAIAWLAGVIVVTVMLSWPVHHP